MYSNKIFKVGKIYKAKDDKNNTIIVLGINFNKELCKYMTNNCRGKRECYSDNHSIGVYVTGIVSCPVDNKHYWEETSISNSNLLKLISKVKGEWARNKLKKMLKERL